MKLRHPGLINLSVTKVTGQNFSVSHVKLHCRIYNRVKSRKGCSYALRFTFDKERDANTVLPEQERGSILK